MLIFDIQHCHSVSCRIHVVPCQVGSVSSRARVVPCQGGPVSGSVVPDRGVSACPCPVGATLHVSTLIKRISMQTASLLILTSCFRYPLDMGRTNQMQQKVRHCSLWFGTIATCFAGRLSVACQQYEHSGRRGAVDRESGKYFGGFGPWDRSQRRGNGREKPWDRISGPSDHSGPISGHFCPFRARPHICDVNFVLLPQLRCLRGHN